MTREKKSVESAKPSSFYVLENVLRVDVHTAKGVHSIHLAEVDKMKNYCVFEHYLLQSTGRNKKEIFFEEILQAASKVESVKELAEITGYCKRTLTRLFNKYLGITPYNWIKNRKAEVIVHFLQNTDYSVKDLACIFGYNSSTGFTAFCRNSTGFSPEQIRKKAEKTKKVG